MQVLECLKIKKQAYRAQNIIEFIFVFPLLIFLTIVIFEVALFWQEVNAIYNLNAEINANVALKDDKEVGLNVGDACPAATKALEILEKRSPMISLTQNDAYTKTILDGTEPLALYKYEANPVSVAGVNKSQVTMWIDCRNPFENGVMTQLEFYHKTLIINASIPRFDGEPAIVIIPQYIFIASPKLNSLRHY